MGIQIITDSASDIICDNNIGVKVIPMKISFGNDQYIDGVTLTHKQFYEKLIECEDVPTTSQVTPFEFDSAFSEAVKNGDQVVCITMSAKLSATNQSARIASESYKKDVFVVDSEQVAIGEKILVKHAMNLKAEGLSAAQIAEKLEADKKRICLIALLDTLEYLKKGGRISKTAAIAGGILSIKPVVAIENGEVVIKGKARGSKHGNNMLTENIKANGGIDFDMPYALGYTGLSDELIKKYISDSKDIWFGKCEKPSFDTIGGTIGTHAGPGAIALAYFHK